MKYEVGKKYNTRGNVGWRKVIEIDESQEAYKAMVIRSDAGSVSARYANGRWSRTGEDDFDLTTEYVEPEKPTDLSKPDEWFYMGLSQGGETSAIYCKDEYDHNTIPLVYRHKIYRIAAWEEVKS